MARHSRTSAGIPPASDDTPLSPCVRNCCLDECDVCLGCGRTLQEIQRWHTAGADGRRAIAAAAAQRCRARELRSTQLKGNR